MRTLAELDPVLSQAISTLVGAIAMAIIAWSTYYFPRGHSRTDDEIKEIEAEIKRRRAHGEDAAVPGHPRATRVRRRPAQPA